MRAGIGYGATTAGVSTLTVPASVATGSEISPMLASSSSSTTTRERER